MLFYIYFENWSFIHKRLKYTLSENGLITHRDFYTLSILFLFSIMYSNSCTGSPGRIKVYKKPNLQCLTIVLKTWLYTNSQFLVYIRILWFWCDFFFSGSGTDSYAVVTPKHRVRTFLLPISIKVSLSISFRNLRHSVSVKIQEMLDSLPFSRTLKQNITTY